jgi:cobalt-zinc-cadmium efflux system membrane fusion protein
MISTRVRGVSGLMYLCVCLSGATACTQTQARGVDAPPVTVETAGDADVITVPHPEQFPLVQVNLHEGHPELQLPGVVAADVSRSVPVTGLAAGRVVDLRAHLGDSVNKGALLLTMTSPDAAQARADVLKAQADAELAQRALDRATVLSEHEALAAKDFEAAVNANRKAQADRHAAEARMKLLGGTADQGMGGDQATPLIELRAPVTGTIIEQNITGGAGVKSLDNQPNLFTIADLSRVWVLCDIYENSLSAVRVGDQATVKLNAFPDKPLTARVTNISRVLDPQTRTAKVRLELPNADGLLRPGMFASVVFTSQQSERQAQVPQSAVLRLHDKDWVFMPVGDHRFRRIEIRAGIVARNGAQQVLAGVQPGDRVVANALEIAGASEQ